MYRELKSNSHLFTIRVWVEEDTDNQMQCRGKLQHIPSGEIRHFRDWAALIPLMLDLLRRNPNPKINEQGEDQPADQLD